MPVVSLTGFKPTPRYDSVAWSQARIEESEGRYGPWTEIEVIALSPVDSDPSDPQSRSFTSDDATLTEGWYRVVFLDPSANEDPSAAVFSGPVTLDLYPSLAELLAGSDTDALLTMGAVEQATLRASAIRAIEAWCNQAFIPYVGELAVRTENSTEVYMPRRLRSITSITPFEGDAMELDAVRIEQDGAKIRFEKGAVGVGYYSQALYEVSGGDYATGFGTGTLLIVGEWGWEETPEAIELAIRYDMEEQALADANQLSATTHAFRRMGLNSVGQGSLQAQLVSPPTLTPRVLRLVEPYLWLGPGGRLA